MLKEYLQFNFGVNIIVSIIYKRYEIEKNQALLLLHEINIFLRVECLNNNCISYLKV